MAPEYGWMSGKVCSAEGSGGVILTTIAAWARRLRTNVVRRPRLPACFLSDRRAFGTLPRGYRWLAVLAAVAVAILVAAPSPAHAETHSVSAVTVATSTRTTATATVTVSAAGTFHVRFSLRGENAWTAATSQTATAAGPLTFSLTGLTANAYYNVDASSDSTFASGVKSQLFHNRPAHLDFATGDANIATGIAGDANTLWLTIDQPLGGGASLFKAYKRQPATEIGERDASKDFTGFYGNHTPGGSWSDGSYLYAADASQLRVYAYNLSNGARVMSREFALGPQHKVPRGVWANDDTFWVVNQQTDVLAYKRTPSWEYGDRDSAKDITVQTPPSYALNGIWSDGETLWVVDGRDKRAYAYNLKLGIPWPGLDIPLSRDHTWASHAYGAIDIWGDGEYLWVTDSSASRSRVFVYYQPKPAPMVSGLTVTSVTSSATTIRADTIYVSSETTFYLRHKSPFADSWAPTVGSTGTENVDFALTGLSAGSHVLVQVSSDSTFSDGTEATDLLLLRPSQQDFDLNQRPGSVRGIWTDGSYMWVLQRTRTFFGYSIVESNEVFSYSMSTKAYDSGRRFAVNKDIDPQGLQGHGNNLFVVDDNDQVRVYQRPLVTTGDLGGFVRTIDINTGGANRGECGRTGERS